MCSCSVNCCLLSVLAGQPLSETKAPLLLTVSVQRDPLQSQARSEGKTSNKSKAMWNMEGHGSFPGHHSTSM